MSALLQASRLLQTVPREPAARDRLLNGRQPAQPVAGQFATLSKRPASSSSMGTVGAPASGSATGHQNGPWHVSPAAFRPTGCTETDKETIGNRSTY
jgi:hypothetical protein